MAVLKDHHHRFASNTNYSGVVKRGSRPNGRAWRHEEVRLWGQEAAWICTKGANRKNIFAEHAAKQYHINKSPPTYKRPSLHVGFTFTKLILLIVVKAVSR